MVGGFVLLQGGGVANGGAANVTTVSRGISEVGLEGGEIDKEAVTGGAKAM